MRILDCDKEGCLDECLDALSKVHKDAEAYAMIEKIIKSHFEMIKHMKNTSLYDVYTYEERVTEAFVEPMRIIAYENDNLKKEVNSLRKQLGMCKKYK